MFIDSSAIVEILIFAPEREELMRRIELSKTKIITNATVIYEASVVISSRLNKEVKEAQSFVLDFLDEIDGTIMPITGETASLLTKFLQGRNNSTIISY